MDCFIEQMWLLMIVKKIGVLSFVTQVSKEMISGFCRKHFSSLMFHAPLCHAQNDLRSGEFVRQCDSTSAFKLAHRWHLARNSLPLGFSLSIIYAASTFKLRTMTYSPATGKKKGQDSEKWLTPRGNFVERRLHKLLVCQNIDDVNNTAIYYEF